MGSYPLSGCLNHNHLGRIDNGCLQYRSTAGIFRGLRRRICVRTPYRRQVRIATRFPVFMLHSKRVKNGFDRNWLNH
jgi:hypothetical protein